MHEFKNEYINLSTSQWRYSRPWVKDKKLQGYITRSKLNTEKTVLKTSKAQTNN